MFTDEEKQNIRRVVEQAQIEVKGNLVNNFEDFIKFAATSNLSEDEKVEVRNNMAVQRDIQNLLWFKRYIYKCLVCQQKGRTALSCEFCVKDYLEKQFDNRKSKNEKLNKKIRKA